MDLNEDNWVRIFNIPDVSKHKKGFTIYKVISMLYPKNCPDSVTKVTVWKRYNDFKKLHREIKAHHKALKLKDKLPSLPSSSYFRRFDDDVIQQRRVNILKFLEFLAMHSKLFSSDACVKFFKTSYTPCELLTGNIHSIRAELNLPVESDLEIIRSTSEEDHTISDTDSVSTLSSTMEFLPDPISQNTHSKVSRKFEVSLTNSCASSHDSLSVSGINVVLDASIALEGQVFPTPPQTPNYATTASPTCYILEASQHITRAVDLEVATQYEEAFAAYKLGIDVLLRNVRDDKDYERKEMVRHKIEKYLLRAEKIYNIHLSPESKTIQNYTSECENEEREVVQESISDLYKYKVVKIIASGMLVLHSETQQLFYIKVIHKTSKFSNDKLVLPRNVPYMVKMYNFYNCENALFLVLQYCSGANLNDYIKQKLINSEDIFNLGFSSNAMIFDSMNFSKEDEYSDYDSDHSYSDLINDYTSNRINKLNLACKSSDSDTKSGSVVEEQGNSPTESIDETKLHESDVGNVAMQAQDLSLSEDAFPKNLKMQYCATKSSDEKVEVNNIKSTKSSRKSSARSEWSLFDDIQFNDNFLLPLQNVIKWAAQLLLALERLHLLGVICCDLQTKNILIDECGDLVLTYMCNVTEKTDVAFTKSNDLTLAPEMYSFLPVTVAADWWSYGAILYEMLVGMPLKYVHPEGLTAYSLLKIPKYVTAEGRSLLKQLLSYEPHERLGFGVNGAEDIKSHPFFSSVLWDSLAAKFKH